VDNVTPGEENNRPTLEGRKSLDSYPLILRMDNSNHTETEAIPSIDTDTPILRLRGGERRTDCRRDGG
jgi:hypothetical protein